MLKPIPDFDSSELELHARLSGRVSVCPPLDVLLAMEQDALPPELAGPARAHLAECSLCTMLLADMAGIPEPALSAAQRERIAASLPTRKTRSPFWSVGKGVIGVAALLLLMAGSFFLMRDVRTTEVARVQPTQKAAPLQPQEIPFAPLASPSGSAALLTRGGGSGSEPTNEQLLPAFRAYNHADYTAAARQFDTLSAQYPQSGMVLLYLGVAQLALHRDQGADATLRRARETHKPYDADAAQWYSAVAASRVHSAEARPFLEELCGKKTSIYSVRSCEALRAAGAKE